METQTLISAAEKALQILQISETFGVKIEISPDKNQDLYDLIHFICLKNPLLGDDKYCIDPTGENDLIFELSKEIDEHSWYLQKKYEDTDDSYELYALYDTHCHIEDLYFFKKFSFSIQIEHAKGITVKEEDVKKHYRSWFYEKYPNYWAIKIDFDNGEYFGLTQELFVENVKFFLQEIFKYEYLNSFINHFKSITK